MPRKDPEARRKYNRARYAARRDEFAAAERARRSARATDKEPREAPPCGTYAAWSRHLRIGETPCDACAQACREYARGWKRKRREDPMYRQQEALRLRGYRPGWEARREEVEPGYLDRVAERKRGTAREYMRRRRDTTEGRAHLREATYESRSRNRENYRQRTALVAERAGRRGSRWDAAADALVLDPSISTVEAAILTGRTLEAVQSRRHNLRKLAQKEQS